MKTGLVCFLIAVFAGSMALSQTAATPTTATKKKTAVKKKTIARATTRKKTVAAPARQMAPTSDRYREIQQALVDKGYLKSEPNGVWDDQSAEALKQFQTDQHLSPTGKISALSLIDLGLGPKPSTAPVVIPNPSAPQGAHPPEPTDVVPPSPENPPPSSN